jgi:hypothetical protein
MKEIITVIILSLFCSGVVMFTYWIIQLIKYNYWKKRRKGRDEIEKKIEYLMYSDEIQDDLIKKINDYLQL